MNTMSTRTHVRVALAASLVALAGLSSAQPTFESASPTAGSDSSKKANEMADKAMYKEIEYANAKKAGPALIVIPGEVKSNNANFMQKFGPNNIADFAELELSKANFKVLERSDLGPLLSEIQLAYTMGDPQAARKHMQKGKLKTTKWIVKFDILKAEQVAQAQEGFDGRAAGRLLGIFGAFSGSLGGAQAGAVGETVAGSVQTKESSGVWVIGMRYKIMDANTTEQVAQGYTEEKMEIGAKGTSVMGVSSSAQGGVSLDTMVQRLVQKNVWDIDNKHK
ncbi:MAG: hypothetical protein IOMNBAOH_01035 [Rhodocyclaceae bacterium]|nr:hypothetical protein [Rhodocyclaceae bacterium]